MNDDSLKSLDRLIDKNDNAPSQILANLFQKKTGRRISARTIRRARTGPLGRHPVHEVQVKTLGEGEKQNRVSFAKKLLTMNLHYILWSDEKLWELESTGLVHWIKKGAPRPVREVKVIKASVMVWGCVWYSGKSDLYVCDKTIDAKEYINILTNNLLPCIPDSNRYKFQHDNARPHVAEKTQKWLAQFAVNMLEDWPTYSSDLNPMEHVWSWMRTYVNKEAPTDKKSLIKAIEAAWDEIPQSTIQAYIGHLNNVCQQIIAAKGDHV